MSGAPLVTLDIGNTRCKACLFPAGGGVPRLLLEAPIDAAAGVLSDLLQRELAPGARGAISCVASGDVALRMRDVLADRLDGDVQVNPDCGLTLDVEQPETVGRDRLYAARGALEAQASDAIVVDAGTALTVDALTASGHFLGGAIAPGPELMAASLAHGGARLWSVEVRPGAPALGKHTTAALEAGACVGFEGAALHLVRRVAREAGFERPRVVLTGGACAYLENLELAERGAPFSVEPLLVQLGLAAAVGG